MKVKIGIVFLLLAVWLLFTPNGLERLAAAQSECEEFHVAYWSGSGDFQNRLALTSLDGTAANQFDADAPGDFPSSLMDASPDGRWIVFTKTRSDGNGGEDTDVYKVHPDGTGLVNLTNSGGFVGVPSFSSDGSKIAFHGAGIVAGDNGYHVYVMNSDGSGLTRITPNEADGLWYLQPRFSADGTKVVFIGFYNCGTCSEQVFIANVDGSGLTQVTDNDSGVPAAEADQPRFHANPTFVYYITRADSGGGQLFLNSIFGFGETLIAGGPLEGAVENYDVSPNGEKIVYELRHTVDNVIQKDIFIVNADGTNKTNLTVGTLGIDDTRPIFSPDGTKIAFSSKRDGQYERLYVMNSNGSSVSAPLSIAGLDGFAGAFFTPDSDGDGLSDGCDNCRSAANSDQTDTDGDGLGDVCDTDDDGDGFPDLSDNCPLTNSSDQTDTDGDGLGNPCDADDDNDTLPDADDNCPLVENGPRVLFESNRDGDYDIYVMRSDGSGVQELTTNSVVDRQASFNPQGTRTVYISTRDAASGEIYTMNPNGAGRVRLTTNTSSESSPRFSPDGTKIMYASNATGNWEVYVMNADGTNAVNLTNNPSGDYEASFSRDGSKIAFISERDASQWLSEVYIMNSDGTGQTRVTTHGFAGNRYSSSPKFSPDGNRIIYSMNPVGQGDRSEIFLINTDGTDPQGVTDPDDSYFATVSPEFNEDGSAIYFKSEPVGPVGTELSELFRMNLDGTGLTRLTTNTKTERYPSFWAGQIDADNDGIGDACDLAPSDGDNDGITDAADNCPLVPNPNQADLDDDGIGDVCDPSFDANTPVGSFVLIQGPDPGPLVTFSSVQAAGRTSFVKIFPSKNEVPLGYSFCPTCNAWEITTTAAYTPPVTVCLPVPAETSQQDYLHLRVMHGENGSYFNRTTEHVTDGQGVRRVCGQVESLSPFMLASQIAPTAASVSFTGRVITENRAGVRMVRVWVMDLSTGSVRSTTSNSFGYFHFDDLDVGAYLIHFEGRKLQFSPNGIAVSLVDNVSGYEITASRMR